MLQIRRQTFPFGGGFSNPTDGVVAFGGDGVNEFVFVVVKGSEGLAKSGEIPVNRGRERTVGVCLFGGSTDDFAIIHAFRRTNPHAL